MMSEKITSLADFLLARDLSNTTETFTLKTEGGDFPIKIRPITQSESQEISEQNTTYSKKGVPKTNISAVQTEIVVAGVIEPNLKDAHLLKQSGLLTPRDFVSAKFKPGEILEIYKRISSLSGYDMDDEEIVEEIEKNKTGGR